MTPRRPDAICDPYLYDIPIAERHSFCQMVLAQNFWLELAERMGYERIEIDEMKNISYDTHDREAEELLLRWGEQNHTITELFVLLSRMQQYEAMVTIKNSFDSRYHRLIPNILAAPMISNENNESEPAQSHDGDDSDVDAIPQIIYEVLRLATDDWSDKNVLGKGGFATVFKGMWISNAVAIKRIDNRGADATQMNKIQLHRSFKELRHLNSCRNDNILPLYGISMNGAELYLVCQLMRGGSLYRRLFNRPSTVKPLTWQQRINIAGGTARGLRFLHEFKKRPLIHGDIKPANILLDAYNQPKIGDFGLVREGKADETIVTGPYGTPPYVPAEFIFYRKLTTKVDCYSYGICLFELSTGLRALDKATDSYLIETVKTYGKEGKLLELIDKTAPNVDNKDKIFKTLMRLAMNCTRAKYRKRPDMEAVLKFLERTLNFTPYH